MRMLSFSIFECSERILISVYGCRFWAEGTQAWFSASARSDANCDIKSRGDVQKILPELAMLFSRVYGDGPWRYGQDCPHPWPDLRL